MNNRYRPSGVIYIISRKARLVLQAIMTALIAHKYTLLNEPGEPQAYGYLEDQRSVLHNQPVPEGDVIMEIFDVSPRGEAYYIDPVEESRDLSVYWVP